MKRFACWSISLRQLSWFSALPINSITRTSTMSLKVIGKLAIGRSLLSILSRNHRFHIPNICSRQSTIASMSNNYVSCARVSIELLGPNLSGFVRSTHSSFITAAHAIMKPRALGIFCLEMPLPRTCSIGNIHVTLHIKVFLPFITSNGTLYPCLFVRYNFRMTLDKHS